MRFSRCFKPFPGAKSPVSPIVECQQCKEELPHHCNEDQDYKDQDDQSNEGATADDWRQLLEDHIHRIEVEANQANHDDPKQNDSQDNQAKLAEEQEEMTCMTCDWLDVSKAIESVPGGAAPGPDGIPAILLKSAKIPM